MTTATTNKVRPNEQNIPTLEISRFDLWHLLLSTVRYCLPRSTGYALMFPQTVEKYLPYLSNEDCSILLKEISLELSKGRVSQPAHWVHLSNLLGGRVGNSNKEKL